MRAKVEHDNKPQKEVQERASVGLSYSPYLGAYHRINVQRFNTGETVLRSSEILPNESQKQYAPPPINKGTRIQDGLSRRGKTRLRRAAAYYQLLVMEQRTPKAYCTMMTLTYGKEYPTDTTSKKDLDNFLHRLRRNFGETFHYAWVAERQKRGAIHYHILTPNYVPKRLLNEAWNEVVANRLTKEGNEDSIQVLYPNVKAVHHAGRYMVKYCQKEGENIIGNGYAVSQKTSAELKPIYEQCYDITGMHLEDFIESIHGVSSEGSHTIASQSEDASKHFVWISETNAYLFDELLTCTLDGFESVSNTEKQKPHT